MQRKLQHVPPLSLTMRNSGVVLFPFLRRQNTSNIKMCTVQAFLAGTGGTGTGVLVTVPVLQIYRVTNPM